MSKVNCIMCGMEIEDEEGELIVGFYVCYDCLDDLIGDIPIYSMVYGLDYE